MSEQRGRATIATGRRGPTAWGRRDVLRAGGLTVAGLGGLAGCTWLSTDPDSGADRGGRSGDKGKEAAGLREQVRAGKLPVVADRLPDEPLVVEPIDRTGAYGGTWHSALLGTSNAAYIYTMSGYENLVRWTPDWSGQAGTDELVANVVRSFEANDDATVFTFRLRPGMKWSDGEPFTADDVVFAVDDVLLNDEIFPVTPASLTADAGVARIEKIDDHAFRIVFPEPSGLFLTSLATPENSVFTKFPKHYLTTFHQDYNPDVAAIVEQEGFTGWVELFGSKTGLVWGYGENPDLPSLWPWQVTRPLTEGGRVVLDRNPYYWKVDPDGSQLPYLDRVVYDVVNDAEVLLLKAMNGEINLEAGPDTRFTSPANKPLLARNRDEGRYRFVDVSETRMNVMCIYLNLTHQNVVQREIFTNKDFRIGLSHAIDREELVDTVMQRQGEPYQAAPLPESAFYDEEFATQYLKYDVGLANAALDRAFPEKDADGLRLGPDGAPITFTIEFVAEFRPEWADMLELIRRYWLEVGVRMNLRNEDRSLFSTRMTANEHDAAVWHGDGGLGVLQSPVNYFPAGTGSGSHYAVTWGAWYESGGVQGTEPPAQTRRQMELYDRLASTGDAEEQTALMTELLTIAKEQFYLIGVLRETSKYFVASDQFQNLPETMIQGFTYPTPGPTMPEQYFLAP